MQGGASYQDTEEGGGSNDVSDGEDEDGEEDEGSEEGDPEDVE